jgi:hypothetical protein
MSAPTNVCNTQDQYNKAFRSALKYNNEENWKESKPWTAVYAGLWFVFFVWAVMLAMQVEDPKGRTIHLVFALVASPAYVLAYYLSAMASDNANSPAPMGYNRRW